MGLPKETPSKKCSEITFQLAKHSEEFNKEVKSIMLSSTFRALVSTVINNLCALVTQSEFLQVVLSPSRPLSVAKFDSI